MLHATHVGCYEIAGPQRLAGHLHPGGAFALWSNEPPDEEFQRQLAAVFETCAAHVVRFHNPLQNREATNTVYVARTRR